MFPLCSVLTPHHSALPTGEMTVRNWEERRRAGGGTRVEGRELTKSCLTVRRPTGQHWTPTFLFFVFIFLPWLVVVRLFNKDYQIEKYWTFSNSKGFHTDFVFKNFMWEIRGANKLEPLHFPYPQHLHLHLQHSEHTASVKCKKCSILPLNKLRETISGRVMAWWLDGLYL